MAKSLRAWLLLSGLLALGLLAGAAGLAARGGLPEHELPALWIAAGQGGALLVLVCLAAVASGGGRRPRALGFADEIPTPARVAARPFWTLFLVSAVALFVELMLIRYCGAQIRIFSFYKNVPLIGAFLGLGLGACLSRGGARQALLLLLWLLPVAVFLSSGSLLVSNALGKAAALGSSEHILGDKVLEPGLLVTVLSRGVVAGFCIATLVVVTLLFALLGRLLGQAFEAVPRLPGYTVNILGSLVGILGFLAVSFLETPPGLWFAAGLLPLLWWVPAGRATLLALVLVALDVASVLPSYGDTVWSRYQKLVGHTVPGVGHALRPGYLVEISDVFYQVALDLRPEALAGENPLPHYDAVYAALPRPDRVLIVGAGTGNDVAAALRAGARQVVAVDIDPAIVEMGRLHHPERPYDDPRVEVVIDDARHAFRNFEPASFDLVVFGLLDSHTQLGLSSVRLDNYVFTQESFQEARRLLRPRGHLAVTAATFRPWFGERFQRMLEATVTGPVWSHPVHNWITHFARNDGGVPPPVAEDASARPLPSDDWPFLYLPERAIPAAYLWAVAGMMLASVLVLRLSGLPFGSFTAYHGHLFFLGAAFLLMEVHAINRLALLFGTTWLVSGVTIALVLLLIVGANLTVLAVGRVPYALSYTLLAASLALSATLDPGLILGRGTGAALLWGVALLSPVYFAGLVFARSFQIAPLAAPAIGANILGSVLGGWVEYATMATGVRALVLLAAAFYAVSLLLLLTSPRRADAP